MGLHISSAFDSGNIIVDSSDDPSDIRLQIRNDADSDFLQWFHFRVTGARDTDLTLTITNAGDAAYLEGWPDYKVCASYDREDWFRIPTAYENGQLTIKLTPDADAIWLAYFAPYSMERHHDLIADACQSPLCSLDVLGSTIDGQDIDKLTIGSPEPGKKNIWFIARQHPGESMAEWWMEGAIERLLDPDDPISRKLLGNCVFHLVPNMNPDGSKRGHLRTNAKGVNLNRVWHDPQLATEPEVYHVRQAMIDTDCDFHLDVHGDEALPYVFLAGYESIPSLTDAHLADFHRYQDLLVAETPDFQKVYGYDLDPPKSSDLKKCTEWTAEQFGCFAATLEMPFKDNADLPDEDQGWSPERSRQLARDCIGALLKWLG